MHYHSNLYSYFLDYFLHLSSIRNIFTMPDIVPPKILMTMTILLSTGNLYSQCMCQLVHEKWLVRKIVQYDWSNFRLVGFVA